MDKYFEALENSQHIREEQYNQLIEYLATSLKDAEIKRDQYFQPDFTSIKQYTKSIEKYREDLLEVIGYPREYKSSSYNVKEIFVGEDELCKIYRLFITVAEGLECYGLYMVPKKSKGKQPLMLCFHGAGGCPEMICNIDSTANYNDASRRFVNEGYIVFAPLFSFASYADGDRTNIPANCRVILDVKAKWIGSSLAALELFKVEKAIDYLQTREEIDSEKVCVTGLSYGGFYSLLIAAIDTRIKMCISSCYFNNRIKINEKHPEVFSDWTWKGSIEKFSDVELIGLICPRGCIIEVGINDTAFNVNDARKESVFARDIYKKLGIAHKFKFIEFLGNHEFNLIETFELLKQNDGYEYLL